MTASEIILIVLGVLTLASVATSWGVLYSTFQWRNQVQKTMNDVQNSMDSIRSSIDSVIDVRSELVTRIDNDIDDLRKLIDNLISKTASLKTMSEAHDKTIACIRRDLMDFQVATGIAPSREETESIKLDNALNEKLDNLAGEVRALQEDRKETVTIISSVNDQLKALSDAYNGIHAQEEKLKELDVHVGGLTDVLRNVVERVEHLEEYS